MQVSAIKRIDHFYSSCFDFIKKSHHFFLCYLPKESKKGIQCKSGFMVGFGEKRNDINNLIDDLAAVECDFLTIGQYLQPTRAHWPVQSYYSPEEFGQFEKWALEKGFKKVESGPLVRSSYHAKLTFKGGSSQD